MNKQGMGFLVTFIVMYFIATMDMSLGAKNTSVCSEQERIALLKFKQSVEDQFGMLSSWIGSDCCQWEGVRCDVSTGHVVSLRLRGHNIWNSYNFPESFPVDDDSLERKNYYYPPGKDFYLVGDEVNSALAELRHLKYLDLSGNDFRKGMIPEFIGSLKQLIYLNLSNAGFGRTIPPHIGNLSKLEVLDLSSLKQDLMADNMAWVFGLSSLKHLDLSRVYLRQAQNLDMVFHMIPSLINVSLSHCGLTNTHLGPHLNSSSILPNIRRLDLSENYFKAKELLVFLQNMTSLEFLDLSNSDFILEWNLANLLNMIPSLSELHMSNCQLQSEHLSTTHLNISTLSNIQHLDLSSNSIEGLFPSFLTNMSSLRVLDLHGNFLNSPIPVMPNLLKLDISSNNFTDIKHVGIWRHCRLKELSVSQINLGEEISGPSTNISECSQYALEVLHLDHNQLSGSIPKSMTRLANLRVLDLSSNRLTGSIPVSLGGLSALEVLDLSSNRLNGTIPESLCTRTALEVLDLSGNRLSGEIPKCLENLEKLRAMLFSSNELSGVIPGSIGHNSLLSVLGLNNNSFTGELPQELRNLHDLWILDLGDNDFSGKIAEWIAELTELVALSLYKNNFTGRIPSSLCKNPCLQILDVAQNNLIGSIPSCLGTLQGMIEFQNCRHHISLEQRMSQVVRGYEYAYSNTLKFQVSIDLSSNELVGQIPEELTALSHLVNLNLSYNHLSGSIPDNIGNLKNLERLDFSDNELTGMIPQSVASLNYLGYLNVSHNNLSGPIPTGNNFQMFNDPSVYADNGDLCGDPLPKRCPTPTKNYDEKVDERKQEVWWFQQWDIIMSGFATGFCGVIGVLLINKAWRHQFYRLADVTMDKIYVAMAINVNKIKRLREAA